MKRILCLLLALALLTGCGPQSLTGRGIEVEFYYVNENPDYFSPLGILGTETHTLREDQNNPEALMDLYLRGPVTSQELSFPKGLRLIRTEPPASDGGRREITLVFDDALAELTGIELQLACVCIARTLRDFGGYETVSFRAEHQLLDGDREEISIRPGELVLEDHSAGQQNAVVMLYFSDSSGRYLSGELSIVPEEDSDNMPKLIVSRLIEGPKSDALLPTIPQGTILQKVSVVDRVCVVIFSEEFRENRPETALEERMTVFSLVNSLTQLDEVDSVDIMVQGQTLGRYLHLDLSAELMPDERMIAGESAEDELDATLYLGLEGKAQLAAYPVRVQTLTDILKALCGFQSLNGYYSPAQDLVREYEVQEQNGDVSVILETESAGAAQLQKLTRSVIATMRELPEVKTLHLIINGDEIDQSADPFSDDWILP